MPVRKLPPLDPEDRALWDALKQQVRPLDEGARRTRRLEGEMTPAPPRAPFAKADQRTKPYTPPPTSPPELIWQPVGRFAAAQDHKPALRAGPSDLRAGGSRGLDRARAERLRRGKMPLEGRLDLHGLTQAQARARLETFILAAFEAGKRTLLVITGKGSGSGGRGVLRTTVPQWLGQAPLGALVLAFSYAQKRDGEQGALYVLLRRNGRYHG